MMRTVECLLVSHTHWDREWYRTFQAFRARLVDAVERVLDLLEQDPGWTFQLDGQTIVIEDYLELRPQRAAALQAAVRERRLAIGPWYVQPDSLLPAGETHIRNLLEGRRVAQEFGGSARVAYTPDSFGHPAQLPQIFAGFGLEPFVYWRGDDDASAALGPAYRWVAPDGSAVTAWRLRRGYFDAAVFNAQSDVDAVAEQLAKVGSTDAKDGGPVVLMAGIDHAFPAPNTAAVAEAIAARTGWSVRRTLLDDLRTLLASRPLAEHSGELLGSTVANLLPGVWSTRTWIKLASREAERALTGWAEPWSALGAALGLPDERPALRRAWRPLLANQAHDSICGCSQDEVHEQMRARFATATELADQTTQRVLERVAGLGDERRVPWSTSLEFAVFNPSPHPRTDVVRIPLDGFPLFGIQAHGLDIHPLSLASASVGAYRADGQPARTVRSDDPRRVRMLDDFPPLDVEIVVRDVPAFGYTKVRLEPADDPPEAVDDGRRIAAGSVVVEAGDDGTLSVTFGEQTYSGLLGIDDAGDRGDTYDHEPVAAGPQIRLEAVRCERRRHVSEIERLVVTRDFAVPAGLVPSRDARADDMVVVSVVTEARVAPGVERVDLTVTVDNAARDHRLRLAFPTGAPAPTFAAATTFGIATRVPGPPRGEGWTQAPVATFPHQGWVAANGLVVVAPGLPEAEVTDDGTVLVTFLRAVGWLSRYDLPSRPEPAGPGLPTPAAQCLGTLTATLALMPVPPAGIPAVSSLARDAELGLRAVAAGDAPLVEAGRPLLEVGPAPLVLSAVKPLDEGDGIVVRVLNPGEEPVAPAVRVHLEGRATARTVRLDETPLDGVAADAPVVPHALRTVVV